MGNMAFFRGGGYRRWLPPEIGSADEAVLVRRCWELLVSYTHLTLPTI